MTELLNKILELIRSLSPFYIFPGSKTTLIAKTIKVQIPESEIITEDEYKLLEKKESAKVIFYNDYDNRTVGVHKNTMIVDCLLVYTDMCYDEDSDTFIPMKIPMNRIKKW